MFQSLAVNLPNIHITSKRKKSGECWKRKRAEHRVSAIIGATGATKMQIGSPSGVTSQRFFARPKPGVVGAYLLLFFHCNNWV